MIYHHQSGKSSYYQNRGPSIEFWRSDDRFKASIHFHWNWRGKSHWLCIFLPEL